MARFCQFCYSSGAHKRDCPDVSLNYDIRSYAEFEPTVAKPRANSVIDPYMDWVHATIEGVKAHHDKRGLPPLTSPPPPPPEPFPEPAKLVAIDKITGQVYRDLEHQDTGCIGMADGVAYYLPEHSYEIDFE